MSNFNSTTLSSFYFGRSICHTVNYNRKCRLYSNTSAFSHAHCQQAHARPKIALHWKILLFNIRKWQHRKIIKLATVRSRFEDLLSLKWSTWTTVYSLWSSKQQCDARIDSSWPIITQKRSWCTIKYLWRNYKNTLIN